MISNRFSSVVIVLLSIVLVGCPSRPFQPGDVQKKWSQNLRQLGIVPLFPPREDFVVGDIYVTNFDPESRESESLLVSDYGKLSSEERALRSTIGMNSRIHRLDLSEELFNEYSATLSAPQTTNVYNSILENPALAAIEDKIAKETAAWKALTAKLSAANQAQSDTATNLVSMTRLKEDADNRVTEAEASLAQAKGKKQSVSDEQEALTALEMVLREKEDKLLDAKRLLEDTADDDLAGRQAAQENIKEAEREKENTVIAITRLKADIAGKMLIAADFEKETQALADAIANQKAVEQSLLETTRLDIDQKTKTASSVAEITPKIVDAKVKLDATKEVKKAISIAGAKFLYPQPEYSGVDVFKGVQLSGDLSHRLSRLRLVAFPEFSSTIITQFDLAALIPAEALSLNISASNVKTVVVKVPAAESYGLSFSKYYKKVFENREIGGKQRSDFEKDIKNTILNPSIFQVGMQTHGEESRYLYFRLVSEVFYARAIDINLFGSSSREALVEIASPLDEGESIDSAFTGVIDSSATGDKNNILSGLKNNLGRTQSVPGGAVQLLSYSDSSVGLRRVYDRPIAIGFRGVTVVYDRCINNPSDAKVFPPPSENKGEICEGAVVSAVVSNTSVPTFMPSKND